MHSLRKRLVAAALSLLVFSGLGHYLLGARRAGSCWAGAVAISFVGFVGTCLLGTPGAFASALALVLLLQIAAAADLFRKRNSASPKTSRVALVALFAFGAVTSFKAVVKDRLVEAYRIPGGSMYPNLNEGDHILVAKAPRLARGEVVAVRLPNRLPYVRRVIALGGDTIELREGEVWLNKQQLPHERIPATCSIEPPCKILNESIDGRQYRIAIADKSPIGTTSPEMVPEDHVYVMGDARDWGADSRIEGVLSTTEVIGTVRFVWWPPTRFGFQPNAR